MKKNIIIGIICLLVLLLLYFGYKTFLLINYKVDTFNIEEDSKKIINITTKNQAYDKISKFSIISYKDFEDDFILEESNMADDFITYKSYSLKTNNSQNYKAKVEMSTLDTNLYKSLINEKIKGIDKDKLLDKYNINNDCDIIKYIINHSSVNIFSSSDKIKMNYLMNTFANKNINTSKVYLIDGNIKGYIYVTNNTYDVHFYYQSYQSEYELIKISFKNIDGDKYFDLEYIKNFLSYIKLEYGIE